MRRKKALGRNKDAREGTGVPQLVQGPLAKWLERSQVVVCTMLHGNARQSASGNSLSSSAQLLLLARIRILIVGPRDALYSCSGGIIPIGMDS